MHTLYFPIPSLSRARVHSLNMLSLSHMGPALLLMLLKHNCPAYSRPSLKAWPPLSALSLLLLGLERTHPRSAYSSPALWFHGILFVSLGQHLVLVYGVCASATERLWCCQGRNCILLIFCTQHLVHVLEVSKWYLSYFKFSEHLPLERNWEGLRLMVQE